MAVPQKAWPCVKRALAALALLLSALSPSLALAQDTHLLLITGVSGDDELAGQYKKWATAVVESAKKGGVIDANITYLSESPERDKSRARGTREAVEQAVTDIAKRAKPNDEVF